MQKRFILIISTTLLLLILSACSTNDQQSENNVENQQGESVEEVELTVSAAASLQDALQEITESFESDHPEISVNYNFGASGSLQQQISQGAPVDLFFSAAEDKFEQLVEEGLIDEEDGIDLVGNEIVLVVANDSDLGIESFEDLDKAGQISIGTPESVPAGTYAKESLENINVWNDIEDKVVYANDVRQVLTYVETGNVDAGIVYKTDALISSDVEIVAAADEDSHGAIIYPLGIINTSSHSEEAETYYNYLQTDESISILEDYGFRGLE